MDSAVAVAEVQTLAWNSAYHDEVPTASLARAISFS
jgi:hypothetical protein